MKRIVLDTGVFFRIDRLAAARDAEDPVVIPAVAYAERLRHLAARGVDGRAFRQALGVLVKSIEPFSWTHAERFVPNLADAPRARWRRLARDAMIAGHVGPGDELWTTDASYFLELGLAESQIVAV